MNYNDQIKAANSIDEVMSILQTYNTKEKGRIEQIQARERQRAALDKDISDLREQIAPTGLMQGRIDIEEEAKIRIGELYLAGN
jgi:hypothetical protein